jgi:hypothetical protein
MNQIRSNWRSVAISLLSATILGIAACASTPPAPAGPRLPTATDMTFAAIARRYLDEMLPLTPVAATALGDHRYDATLDDVSAEGSSTRSWRATASTC